MTGRRSIDVDQITWTPSLEQEWVVLVAVLVPAKRRRWIGRVERSVLCKPCHEIRLGDVAPTAGDEIGPILRPRLQRAFGYGAD